MTVKTFFIAVGALIIFLSPYSEIPAQNKIKVAPPDYGVYTGIYPAFSWTEDSVNIIKMIEYTALATKKPAIIYFSNNWMNKIVFPEQSIKDIIKFGSVPYIRFMPRSGFTQDKSDDVWTTQKIVDGVYDYDLKIWADGAKMINSAMMLEFAPEMNGNWFPWSGLFNNKDPELYKKAYRHVVDLFRNAGVENITYVFHVNGITWPVEPWNTKQNYYPGDDYVDWIGVSVYGSQFPGTGWTEFTDVLDKSYDEVCKLSPDKPLCISEFAVIEDKAKGSKADWVKKAYGSIKNNKYPRIKMLCYWSSSWTNADGSFSTTRIDSSPETLEIFRGVFSDPFFLDKAKVVRYD